MKNDMNEMDKIASEIVDAAFNVPLIKQGIRRIVNDFQES